MPEKRPPVVFPPANDAQIRAWARVGAIAQVTRAFATFPEIRAQFLGPQVGDELPRAWRVPEPSGPADGTVEDLRRRASDRRGRMTPAGRKRISDLMKKRWKTAKRQKRNHL